MFERPVTVEQLAVAAAFVLVSALGGVIVERVLASRPARIPFIGRWGPNRVLLAALRGMPFTWCTLFGLRAAALVLVFRPRYADLFHNALLAAFIVSVTVAGARAVGGLIQLYARRGDGILAVSSIFVNLARISVVTIGVLILLQSVGISITPALTALGVGGLAVALALQDTLSNIFAGLHIIASRQVNPGDYVKLATGEDGYVSDINWRNTTIRSLQNNTVIVPNSRLASAIVTNFYQPAREMAVLVDVHVGYESDLAEVETVTIEVAREVMRSVPGGILEFEPFIRYHTLADFSIKFTVILRASEFVDQYLLKHEFIKRLQARYRRDGIRIPFPTRTLYINDSGAPDRVGSSPRAGRTGNW